MSLFFPEPQQPIQPIKPPATTTLTLEKALTDAFIQALQAELGTALTVTLPRISMPSRFRPASSRQHANKNQSLTRQSSNSRWTFL
jgi:hypothetical protein